MQERSRARKVVLFAFFICLSAATDPLQSFVSPQEGACIDFADIVPPTSVSSPAACADLCLAHVECISFNLCGSSKCGLSGWNASYTLNSTAKACSVYHRILSRNDTRLVPALSWKLSPPPGNVTLSEGGILGAATLANIDYLLWHEVDDLLFFFRQRVGAPNPPGAQCFGWDGGLRGSVAGAFLMGAAGFLRWQDHAALREAVQSVVAGIAACADPSGYLMAFNESVLARDENPDYVQSWVTHGLLEASAAGWAEALPMLRARESVRLRPYFLHDCPAGPDACRFRLLQ